MKTSRIQWQVGKIYLNNKNKINQEKNVKPQKLIFMQKLHIGQKCGNEKLLNFGLIKPHVSLSVK